MVRPPTLLNTLTQEHVPTLCVFPFLTEVEDAEEEGFCHPPLVKSIRTHNPHHRALSYDNIRWKWPKKFLPLYGLENDRRAFGCPGCISYRGSCRVRNGPWRGFGSRGSERSPRWGGLAHWPLGELSDTVRPKACFGFPNSPFFPPPFFSRFDFRFNSQFFYLYPHTELRKDCSIFRIVSSSLFIKTFEKAGLLSFLLSAPNSPFTHILISNGRVLFCVHLRRDLFCTNTTVQVAVLPLA